MEEPAPAIVQSARTKNDKDEIWAELVALAAKVHPVDLGIGCPDFAASEALRQDLSDVVDGGDTTVHQCSDAFGHMHLREALSSLYSGLLARPLDPETEVFITNGAIEALFVSFMGLINPGDEVIIIEPFFCCYTSQLPVAGGTPVFVALRPGGNTDDSTDWKLDPEELEAAFSSNTKALVLNTPHNPTGKVFSRSELEMIASLCRKFNVIVLSDEVYEWLTYDGMEHVRIATLPDMWERTITIGSAGKTFSVTGWKIGWMIAPAQLMAGPSVIYQHCSFNGVTPIQEALARGFERETALLLKKSSDCYFLSFRREAEAKRDQLVSLLQDAGLKPVVPQGGYFILADVRDVMSKVDVGGDPDEPKDLRFVRWLCKNKKLQGIPSSVFFSKEKMYIGENYIRLCFLKKDSTLLRGGDILRALGEELKAGNLP